MKKIATLVSSVFIAVMSFSTGAFASEEPLVLDVQEVNEQGGKVPLKNSELEVNSWGKIHEGGRVYIAADFFNVIVDGWSYDPRTKVEYVDVGDVRVYLNPARIEHDGQQLSTPEEAVQLEAGFIPLRKVYELAGYTVHYEKGMIYIY